MNLQKPLASSLAGMRNREFTMFKKNDGLDEWSVGHFLAGAGIGILTTWFYPFILLLPLLISWEWIEQELTKGDYTKLWFIPLDPGGVSLWDIAIDIIGFGLVIGFHFLGRV